MKAIASALNSLKTGACFYGFLATTSPFAHTYSGVPYIRAVFCAS